jgi:retron-type reverse transcriptase
MTPIYEKISTSNGEKVDGLVAQLAMKKFENKYSNSLNEAQKKTLRCFMNFSMTGNKEQFTREMLEERKNIIKFIRSSESLSYFKDDEIMGNKLREALRVIEATSDVISEGSIKDILLFHKLAEEIRSDE